MYNVDMLVGKGGEVVDIYDSMNDILVKLFRDLMTIEEKAIITGEYKDITNNDLHVIDSIGTASPKNMSMIAKELSVTTGTLTIAINSLVKKGYVERSRSDEDRRVVLVSLSEKGRQAYEHHKKFHEEMIAATVKGLTGEEIKILERALINLKDYFISRK